MHHLYKLTLAEYFTKISKLRVLEESFDVGIISPYRAQVQYLKKLIILGNKDTMTKHPFYKKQWEYVESINNYE